MKICVLVKEVPDAAVEKRIDPSTGRMDRSGEKNLNPYDTHAIEAAMQIKEGGAVPVEEIIAVTMGPDSAVRALHKAVSLGADLLLAEATFPEAYAGFGPHMTASQAGALARDAGAAALVLAHVWPTNDRAAMVALAATVYDGPVVVANELDVFEISPAGGKDE